MLCKHALAAESNFPVYQFKNYVLALLANGRHVLHLDNQLAATKVHSRLCARTSQFRCPGSNELSLHNQPTVPGTIDQRNLQHYFFLPADCDNSSHTPNSQHLISLNCKEIATRNRNGEGRRS